MTMTGGSLNIKLVEKSLLDLFSADVLQSVDRSHGKDSGNPRKQHAFQAVEEIPEDDDDTHLDDDFSENDDPTPCHCVVSILGAFITSTMTNCPTGNDCLAFLMATCIYQTMST